MGPDRDAVVWGAQHAFLAGVAERVAAQEGSHLFFRHVLLSYAGDPWLYAEGVPVYCRLIGELDEDRHRPCTHNVFDPYVDYGLLTYTDHDRCRQKSRTFLPDLDLVEEFLSLGPRTAAEASAGGQRFAFSGRTTQRIEKTRHYDDARNPVGSVCYRAAMKELCHGYFHAPGVEAHLCRLEAERDEAMAVWERAGGHEFAGGLRERLASYEQSDDAGACRAGDPVPRRGDRHWQRIVSFWERAHGEPRTPEYLAYRKLRLRFLNDLRCYQSVLQQRPEPTEWPGVYRYRLAYRHQGSGRAGQIGGGFQTCSREMKQAAYAYLMEHCGLRNYDLIACHPNVLIELFEEANATGGGALDRNPLDPSWITAYVADQASKRTWAERVGVAVDTWKTVLCALMNSAALPSEPHNSKGEVVKALRADPACATAEGFAGVYARLVEGVGSFRSELGRWHRWLDTEFVRVTGVNAGGGRRIVKNAAGESYVWDPERPEHKRKAELAAHLLQGKERAFVLPLIALAPEYGFEVIADEHDGVVTIGEVPPAAIERAKERSGVKRAELVPKPFT